MSKYVSSTDLMKDRLKAKILETGRKAVTEFTHVFVDTATDEEVNRVLDDTLSHMSREMLYEVLEKYGLMPHYECSSPEPGVWEDQKAYKKKKIKTPTASITITHPEVKMMCRVTDDPLLPGFIITCKDNNGENREFHIYLSPNGPSIRVCTGNQTNQSLTDDDIIRRNYNVPFEHGRTCGTCCFNCQAEGDTEPVCNNMDSRAYKQRMLDSEHCEFYQ